MLLEEDQAEFKEKCNKLRHQEELLKQFKEKLEKLARIGEITSEKKEILIREARIDFDKYLRIFVADQKPRKSIKSKKPTQDEKISSFKEKWAAYLVEDYNADDDLRPMLGLDVYDPVPKPYKIF